MRNPEFDDENFSNNEYLYNIYSIDPEHEEWHGGNNDVHKARLMFNYECARLQKLLNNKEIESCRVVLRDNDGDEVYKSDLKEESLQELIYEY